MQEGRVSAHEDASSPAIEVTGLACGYDGVAVLKAVSFNVRRG